MKQQIQTEQAVLWKPGHLDGIALFKAAFQRFVFRKHTHDEFAIGVIEQGAQRFHHRGSTHIAPPSSLITVNPDEVHDGESAGSEGYQYRMTYIHADMIEELLRELYGAGRPPGWFGNPVTFDPEIAACLHRAFLLLEQDAGCLLESRTLFIQAIATLFVRHAAERRMPQPVSGDRAVVRRACEYIRAMAAENITLEEIAAVTGLSRFHFLRVFKAATGLPPHVWLVQCRVKLARKAIENGVPLADAALQAGFADQSHMNRCFKAIHGLSPGQYLKAVRL